LATAAQYGIAVVAHIFNNNAYANVLRDQQNSFGGRVVGARPGFGSRSSQCVNIEGEPGACRKAHAGFGEGHPETSGDCALGAPDAHSLRCGRSEDEEAVSYCLRLGLRWSPRAEVRLGNHKVPYDRLCIRERHRRAAVSRIYIILAWHRARQLPSFSHPMTSTRAVIDK
jgi:hypothetical protein